MSIFDRIILILLSIATIRKIIKVQSGHGFYMTKKKCRIVINLAKLKIRK